MTDTMRAFSPDQTFRPGATLLEASAGTGKTHNIATIFVQLIAVHGLNIDAILVVTFTRAATRQLKERLRARLRETAALLDSLAAGGIIDTIPADIQKLIEESETDGGPSLDIQARRIRTALANFDTAAISTIHGFCQRALRTSSFETSVDFDAELCTETNALLEQVTDDFVFEQWGQMPAETVDLIRGTSGVSRDQLLAIAKTVEAHPDAVFQTAIGNDTDPYTQWTEAVDAFKEAWQQHGDDARDRLLAMHANGAFKRGAPYNGAQPKRRAKNVDDQLTGRDWQAIPPQGLSDDFKYFSRANIEKRLIQGHELSTVNPVFAAADQLVLATHGPAEAHLHEFVAHLRDAIPSAKQAANIITTNDLLRVVRDACADPDVREALIAKLQSTYQAALVDEFQDTDPVQWQIFSTIFQVGGAPITAPHGMLFLIGDPKQAIYSFRGADMGTYVAAKNATPTQGRFTLQTNWRSDGPYIAALNHLFQAPNVFDDPDIPYIHVDVPPDHQASRLQIDGEPIPPLSFSFLDTPGLINVGEADRHIPRIVAQQIGDFLSQNPQIQDDSGSWRRVGPGDIAVLTRSNTEAHQVQRALIGANIPSVIGKSGNIYDSIEAEHVQRTMEAMLHPTNERTTRTMLATPLFGIGGAAFEQAAEESWAQWSTRLHEWGTIWRQRGIAHAFRRLIADEGVVARLLQRESGERSMTNLLHLIERLNEAEISVEAGPSRLLEWLQKARSDSTSMDQQTTELRMESDADAVQVVTMHSSKGLEFPVVWCPYLWKGKEQKDANLQIVRVPNASGEQQNFTFDISVDATRPPKKGHGNAVARAAHQETLRLMYVALTRAVHHCEVLWGSVNNAQWSSLSKVVVGRKTPQPYQKKPPPLPAPDDLWSQLIELSSDSNGTISAKKVDLQGAVTPWHRDDDETPQLCSSTFSRTSLDTWWRRTSYSSLAKSAAEIHDGSPESEGIDHDAVETNTPTPPIEHNPLAIDEKPVPLMDFPRGAEAGTCLHEILELFDFQQVETPNALETLTAKTLARHGFSTSQWTDIVTNGLKCVLHTPLGPETGQVTLADLSMHSPKQRLDEMDFILPIAGGTQSTHHALTTRRLAEVFAKHQPHNPGLTPEAMAAIRSLRFIPVRGFLNGKIDLIFRHTVAGQDRWFVVDYKSNWLGDADRVHSKPSHYSHAAMATSVAHHRYTLQYHLYTVALHRYLRWRIGAQYDYDVHFGGVLYLFLRGMTGPTPAGQDHAPGVFFDRPTHQLVEDLSDCLAQTSPDTGTP